MCLFFVLTFLGPRVALLFVWWTTNFIDRAYDNTIVPVLGFFFLPLTTLVYAFAYDGSGLSAWGWLFVVLALFGDLSSYGSASRVRR